MKLSKAICLFAAIILCSATAMAQNSASVVKVSAANVTVKKGGAGTATVTLDIQGGYHINSNRPSETYLIATALKLEKSAGLTLGGVIYPKAKMQKFSFSEKPLSVFEGRTVLKFTVRAGAAAASQTVKGKLTIQACNNEQCLRPQTVNVSIPVEVN
ncbi:MAG: protein-disulfide reductase DsbD domain-containing protein [Acidobacteriota bacterium]